MPALRRPNPTALRVLGSVALALLIAIPIVLLLSHPYDLWWAPRCAWRDLTGMRCPGCGLTRATHHLLQGEVWLALRSNPMAPLVPLLFAAAAWFSGHLVVRGRVPHVPAPPLTVGWIIAGLLGGFWIYRSIVDLLHMGQ